MLYRISICTARGANCRGIFTKFCMVLCFGQKKKKKDKPFSRMKKMNKMTSYSYHKQVKGPQV